MLRMSWRPGRGVLVIEGVVDRGHREVLALASTAAVGASDVLCVALDGAQIDAQGRDALKVMELDLWVRCAAGQATAALTGAPKPRSASTALERTERGRFIVGLGCAGRVDASSPRTAGAEGAAPTRRGPRAPRGRFLPGEGSTDRADHALLRGVSGAHPVSRLRARARRDVRHVGG